MDGGGEGVVEWAGEGVEAQVECEEAGREGGEEAGEAVVGEVYMG